MHNHGMAHAVHCTYLITDYTSIGLLLGAYSVHEFRRHRGSKTEARG